MSLIVARKDHKSIIIVSDTHLSYADIKSASDRQTHHPSAGVIKTSIVNSNIAVSFAGGEAYADEAFKDIKPFMSLSDIKNILLEKHLKSNEETDFIITICDLQPQIFEIKNSTCSEVEAAWIGSKKAFTTFQKFMHGIEQNIWNNSVNIQFIPEELDPELFGTMSGAMDSVIEDPSIPEVDGFRVNVVFTKGKFQYTGYTHNYVADKQLYGIPKGVIVPLSHGTAQDGDYIINFFHSSNSNYAGLHILQGNFGIIYKQENNGLMRPNLIIDTDEIDFINHVENTYQLTPSLLIQDRRPICVKEGDKAFNIGDYTSALSWYNKGLEYCEGKDKAIFYYRKSVAYINLGQYNESIQMINQTIESDGDKYEGSVLELINEMKRRGVEFM
jgi:hypothetical protein